MSGIDGIMLCPSVSINTGYVCNPVATWLQEVPTSGFYAGADDLSVMRCQRARGLDQSRKASRHISPSGSHIAPNFRGVAHALRNQRTIPTARRFPLARVWCRRLKHVRRLFLEVTRS